MSVKFDIKYLDEPNFGRIPKEHCSIELPCYRVMIVYPLFLFYKNSGCAEKTIEEFHQFNTAYDDNRPYENKLLGMYSFDIGNDNPSKGYLLVCKGENKACYPLVIYPNIKEDISKPRYSTRKDALGTVLNILSGEIENIVQSFENHNEDWNERLENHLKENYFHYDDEEIC